MLDNLAIKITSRKNLIDLTAFIFHVGELIVARSEPYGRDPEANRSNGIGAKIPKVELAWGLLKSFAVGRNA